MILDGTYECLDERVDRDGPAGDLSGKRSKLTGLNSVITGFETPRLRWLSVSAFDVALPKS